MDEPQNGIDLGIGLGIGDHYHLPKINEKKTENDGSAPSLHLSFTASSEQEDEGIKVKESFDDDEEEEIKSSNYRENIMKNNSCRKKLRLTKEQSHLLECSFNQHSTLLPVQKHSLAERLNLTPRQVEVWFQNRRARTKLKQTEVECQFLKKRCEILSKENTKLKKELQELKSQKSQLCLRFPTCDHKRQTI